MPDKKKNPYMQPAFLICAITLALFCLGKKGVMNATGYILIKEPIDLRKSFDDIDREKLAPFKVVNESKIANKDVEKELGTEDYIQWVLEDTEVSETSPVRFCSLFITYYGMPDKVPHVPEKCYVGSGYQTIDKLSRNEKLNIEGIEDPVEMSVVTLRSKNTDIMVNDPDFSRMYFFKVNHDYRCTRNGVRLSFQKNMTGKHSFFSKVEWEFFGAGFSGRSRPSVEQNTAASEKLISKLLPVLENEHWPNIDQSDGDEVNEAENVAVSKEETTPTRLKK